MTADDSTLIPQVLLEVPLDRTRNSPSMQRQLHHLLKEAVLCGRLAPGSRLPGTRALSEGLSISRNTVVAAYDLLLAEGYVVSDRQGTRVAKLIRSIKPPPSRAHSLTAVVAKRLSGLANTQGTCGDSPTVLRPGVPALSHFPLADWRRAMDRAIGKAQSSALGYGDPLGEPALRASIARHLSVARGVRCDASQVVVTEGAQEALSLCVRLLTNPGDIAWVEDPGYRGAKAAMRAGDLAMVPIRCDDDGLNATVTDWKTRRPRLIYTTPSHQYPSGAVLTVARRLELIVNARAHGAWIIEDDYDSEFRHAGESIGAMQGLVDSAPVLYVGTFSKTMFPSLRVGFLILPEEFTAQTGAPLKEMLRGGHRFEQLALSDFIESGDFVRHLGRMRRLYRARQRALRDALTKHLRVPHSIDGGHCGMHLTVRLPQTCTDTVVAESALKFGIAPGALSSFALRPTVHDNGLVLGYGNTPSELFDSLIKRLSTLARAAMTN